MFITINSCPLRVFDNKTSMKVVFLLVAWRLSDKRNIFVDKHLCLRSIVEMNFSTSCWNIDRNNLLITIKYHFR